jgi:hypothetical protein
MTAQSASKIAEGKRRMVPPKFGARKAREILQRNWGWRGDEFGFVQDANYTRAGRGKTQKIFLQGLKPIQSRRFTPGPFDAQGELKPRPPKERNSFR